jgi:YVTN family beta-propeller protein
MSAWYVWCAIGLYPQNSAVRYLDVGTPLFSSVVLRSPNEPTIAVATSRSGTGGNYIQGLRVNGAFVRSAWVSVPNRGTLRLDASVGDAPNPHWADGVGNAPPSFATVPLTLPPSTAVTVSAPVALRMGAGASKTLDLAVSNRTGTASSDVAWLATASPGLHVRSAEYIRLAAGEIGTAPLRVSADASLHAGYYTIVIRGIASSGVRLAELPVSVRIDRNGERPQLVYAENAFGNSITPVDLATGETGPQIAVGEYPRDAVLSADATRLYVANLGGSSISVIDTNRDKAIATIKAGSSPNGLALTPDGKTLWFSNADDGTIQPIDVRTLQTGSTIGVGLQPHTIAIAPDGLTLYVSNRGSNTVTPVDLRTRTTGTAINVGPRPTGIAIAPDGKRLYVVSGAEGDVTPIELGENQRALPPIKVGVYPMQIAITPDGKTAYVSNYANSTITPIDLRTDVAAPPIEVGGAPYGIGITSNGRVAAVVSHRDNSCVLLDLGTGRVSRPIPLGSGPYTVAAP